MTNEAVDVPALYGHCVRAYEAMNERATDVDGNRIYIGFTTLLFEELGYSTPYYSHITRKLKAMNCIRMIRRGGGKQMSEWLMLRLPTLDLYYDTPEKDPHDPHGYNTAAERAEWAIRNLSARVLKLEQMLGVVSSDE